MNDKDLAAWLDKNPNPEDEKIHALAQAKGINKHELEDRIYKLATTGAKFKNNGDWNKNKRPAIDPKIIEEGAKIEMEHTDDKATAERIAKDHTSGPGKKNYYRDPAVAAADIAGEMKKNKANIIKKAELLKMSEAAFTDQLNKIYNA